MVHGDVYLFGDSVARGVILNEEGNYTPTKENFGALAAAKLGINLVNKARFGCTITKGLDILRRFVAGERGPAALGSVSYAGGTVDGLGAVSRKRQSAGLAFLEFGGNDCDFLWNEVADRPDAEHLPATPIETFTRKYSEMIDALRSSELSPVIMSLPPLVSERYFDWFTRTGLDRKAILSWLGDVQQIFRWHEEYDRAVRWVATDKDCPLLDIRKDFLEKRDYREYMCRDGIHPNREGHRLIEFSLEKYAALA
jgi:acyl-CoA thioesterase-1